MSINNPTQSIASNAAAECVDKNARLSFLNVTSTEALHVFVTSYIAKCVQISKDIQEKKKKKNVGDDVDDDADDRDLPEIIKDATIDYVRKTCPNFHTTPTAASRGVVESIVTAARAIADSKSSNGKPDKEQYNSAVGSIIQSVRAIFLQRAMFNLMCR